MLFFCYHIVKTFDMTNSRNQNCFITYETMINNGSYAIWSVDHEKRDTCMPEQTLLINATR